MLVQAAQILKFIDKIASECNLILIRLHSVGLLTEFAAFSESILLLCKSLGRWGHLITTENTMRRTVKTKIKLLRIVAVNRVFSPSIASSRR
jgi:hypothetical protein